MIRLGRAVRDFTLSASSPNDSATNSLLPNIFPHDICGARFISHPSDRAVPESRDCGKSLAAALREGVSAFRRAGRAPFITAGARRKPRPDGVQLDIGRAYPQILRFAYQRAFEASFPQVSAPRPLLAEYAAERLLKGLSELAEVVHPRTHAVEDDVNRVTVPAFLSSPPP